MTSLACRRRTSRSGFTLIELTVALVAGLIVALGIMALSREATRTFHDEVRARLAPSPAARALKGQRVVAFAGIGVPRDTPADIVALLNRELNAGLKDTKVRARIEELGGTVAGGTPAEFAKVLVEATDKWAKVIKFAGIKVE